MELFQPTLQAQKAELISPAGFVARYCAVFWEPVGGTGERIVALVAVQPHEDTAQPIAAATYPVITASRLRQLLGRQRGTAGAGILDECAKYMTARQQAGLPLEELRPLFRGFHVGPPMVARAWSVRQLLDAAVRSVSAFGSADEMIDDEEDRSGPRHFVRTAEFLKQLKRIVAGGDKLLAARFDVPLRGQGDVPDVVIDYADGTLAVQVTSLPATAKQARRTEVEAQAKLFELDVARSQMNGNTLRPALLFNAEAMAEEAGEEARRHAALALQRLTRFAKHKHIQVFQAQTPNLAARLLDTAAQR